MQSLGLHDLKPFDPAERVVEYRVARPGPLVAMSLQEFADETSTDSPAPGGGSVAALLGSLAAALTAMVAALTHGKKGHEASREEMDQVAVAAQEQFQNMAAQRRHARPAADVNHLRVGFMDKKFPVRPGNVNLIAGFQVENIR